MFALFAVTMAWAAVLNGLSVFSGGGTWWPAFAVMQVIWTAQIVIQLRKYRRLRLQEQFKAGIWPENTDPPQNESLFSGYFAIASVVLAGVALLLLPSICLGSIVWIAVTQATSNTQLLGMVLSGAADLAVLALGLGSAALSSRNDKRGLAIAGVAISAIDLFAWLGFLLFANLAQ